MEGLSPAIIALIGTIFGGAGFKIIEHVLATSAKKETAATALRTELRQDAAGLRQELLKAGMKIDELEREIETLVALKYQQLGEISNLKIQLAESILNIQTQADQAAKTAEKLP